MNKRWEINRVSTPEHIFNKIKMKMARPVGIILFGADCDFKNEVLDTMVEEMRGFARYHTNAPDTPALVRDIQEHLAVVVTLNSDESSSHELRHELVKLMRNAGVATVVGVYAKATETPVPFGKLSISLAPQVKINKQIAAIHESNPTADGLDYFIIVEEEKEE